MIGIDTNVLVRYLVQDHPVQSHEASVIIEGAEATGEKLFLSSPVLCELAWVLRKAYRFSKADLLRVLETLLHQRAFALERNDLVARAMDAYRDGPAGFADYLIVQQAWNAGCTRFLTFDTQLASGLASKP
jgi:predicted nucleic-acid-binding protein